MAEPLNRDRMDWESRMANVSLAGVRPLVTDTVDVGASSESTYTVADPDVKRVVVSHISGGDGDILLDLNATADATSYHLFSSVYFCLEVEEGDVVHFFNTSGSQVTVHIMEIR